MKKSDLWLSIIASVGVGAATFYTMSKSNHPISKAIQNVVPLLSNMNDQQNNNDQQSSTNTMTSQFMNNQLN